MHELGHSVYPASGADSTPIGEEDLCVLWLEGRQEEGCAKVARRRRQSSEHLPILVVGPWVAKGDIDLILQAGADDYLVAPVTAAELQIRLLVMERRMKRSAPDAAQRRLEERLSESQRIETLTTLAGTLAHDFNNILAAILGNAELALLDSNSSASIRYSLEQIDKASRRAAEITRQMLTYSGRGDSALGPIDLTALVEEMGELLRISLSKRCSIHHHFTRPLPLMVGDASQLRQIIMNLLLNASEAIGGGNGEVHVRTGVVDRDDDGRWVSLEVEDNGIGMSPETLSHIFDPFFTTKRTGRGLGLAAVQGIVQAHRGEISVHSELGRGSRFTLLFPTVGDSAASSVSPSLDMPDWHGTGTILLVDDEEAVREAARRLLKKAGFNIYEAASGDEGAEMFCRYADELQAVILDLNMPGLDGFEVYQIIREVRPQMRVIVWSGFDAAAAREKLAQFGDPLIIEKPTSARELAIALKQVLSSPSAEPRRTLA